MPERWENVKWLMRYLRISERKAYYLIATGEIPAVRVGHRIRLKPSEVEAHITRRYRIKGEGANAK
jgi:excisionase family DNA binding protein